MTTLPSGQIIPVQPALRLPPVQHLEGSALEAASTKTLASNSALAETAAKLGAGQKGSGRKKLKKLRKGGAQNLHATLPSLPEAGTIPGVSHANNHLANVNNLNQLVADRTGDALMNAQPYDPTPTKGGRRTKRYRKAKNGRSNKRTHRRGNRKSSAHRRRSRSSLLRSMAKSK
jgi:hypothetical protein